MLLINGYESDNLSNNKQEIYEVILKKLASNGIEGEEDEKKI